MNRVLVVDDEVTVCDLLKDFLALKGYEVFTASDGYIAINKVKKLSPHLDRKSVV